MSRTNPSRTNPDRTITFLLSSAGRRVELLDALRDGASRAGAAARVVATDRSPLSPAGHLADSFQLVPSISDEAFVPTLASIIERESVDVVIPTIDTELAILARERATLEQAGAAVLVSDPELIEICADKSRSSAWMSDHGFPVPVQYPLDEAMNLPASAWPLFYKPKAGSSSIGALVVENPDQLRAADARFGPGVVEELIVGDEFTADCWVDRSGQVRGVVPRKRLAVRAGEIAKGVTAHQPALDEAIHEMIAKLPASWGPVTIQAFMTDDGPKFIEINPRFGGGYPLSHHSGAWYTAVLTAEVLGSPVDENWFDWQPDMLMLRHDRSVFLPRSAADDMLR